MMQVSGLLPDVSVVLPSAGGCRSPDVKHCSSFFEAKCLFSPGFSKDMVVTSIFSLSTELFDTITDKNKAFHHAPFVDVMNCSFSNPKLEIGPEKLRTRGFMVRASGNSGGDLIPVAPLQLESPVGQLLAQILQTHPHLLLATAEQQLENLQSQRDGQNETTAPSSQDLLLYKRIAEVKEKERRKTLEEIIYCLIVQRFVANHISMIPKISTTSDPTGRVDLWPNQEQQLESVHSAEAFEMILSHLSLVLGERVVGPLDTIIQISKIKLGKLYAASIMYGYFLRRVDERYQLERSMNTLPEGFGEERVRFEEPTPEKQLWDPDSLIRIYPDEDDGGGIVDSSSEEKSYKLRSYVMYLDAETLQRYATIRSKEAISLIEKQTQALFGQPDITVTEDGSLDASNDEVVSLTFSGLTMLVLEAVTFGSFLWDTENYVESKYPFINS
ncbi:UNVERIFIED_CONTAM: UV-B-induced protein, chloroplastic [Sesamum angustifolium]|uniref:UV-B-induced protein, chloroplastic n=1 Tax=Sesamum angustifolium TaxID=2727405 RepID=A0AAW2MJH7_9LAMI